MDSRLLWLPAEPADEVLIGLGERGDRGELEGLCRGDVRITGDVDSDSSFSGGFTSEFALVVTALMRRKKDGYDAVSAAGVGGSAGMDPVVEGDERKKENGELDANEG